MAGANFILRIIYQSMVFFDLLLLVYLYDGFLMHLLTNGRLRSSVDFGILSDKIKVHYLLIFMIRYRILQLMLDKIL